MNVLRLVVGAVGALVSFVTFASTSVSLISAELTTDTDELTVSYKIKDSDSVRVWLYRDASSLDYGWTLFRYNSKDSQDVSDGEHVLTFNTQKEFGMSGTEILQKYPNANLVIISGVKRSGQLYSDQKELPVTFVTPADPLPGQSEADALQIYRKAQRLSGVCFSRFSGGYDPYGTYEFNIGAINKKTMKVKVTFTLKPLLGGRTVKASQSFAVDSNCGLSGYMDIRSMGPVAFDIAVDVNDLSLFLASGNVDYGNYELDPYSTFGGAFDRDELYFSVDRAEYLEFEDGLWELFGDDGHPNGAIVHVKKGTKLSVDKAPKLSYKKYVDYDSGETPVVCYRLAGLDDPKRTNYSNLSISYAAKTGVFKGSFYVYATNGGDYYTDYKPVLKKYKATFSGIVVDQVGKGTAVVKVGETEYTWNVTLE